MYKLINFHYLLFQEYFDSHNCLVLVGFRDGFGPDLNKHICYFHNQTKWKKYWI